MNHRKLTMFALGYLLTLGALSASVAAQAHEPTHYTYVALWAVPRAQWTDFEKSREQARPVLEKLMSDGTLVAWSFDVILVHTEEGYTHANWFVSPNLAGIAKTLEALRPLSTGSAYGSVTKHSDLLLHTLVHNGKPTSITTGYLRVSIFQVKPGEGEHFEESFNKYFKPMLDAELADGTVLSYSFSTESIHTQPPGGYAVFVLYATAEGLDKGAADLAALLKENPAIGAASASETVGDAHRDGLGRVLAYAHK